MISWNQTELVNWIGTDSRPLKPRSRASYKTAFANYHEYTRRTAKQLIDEAEREESLSKRERGSVKRRILGFRSWLKERKGLSPKTVHSYVGAIRSFYRASNYVLTFQRGEIPKPYAITERKMITLELLKKLLDSAFTQRDKAINVCQYQSGMDISTLLSLNYGDVVEGLRNTPLKRHMLTIVRRKTRMKYRTFFGKDAMVYLANYLQERGRLRWDDPLFVGLIGEHERLTPIPTIKRMRTLVVRAGLITEEELKRCTINPYGTHALRESFSKIATSVGLNKNLIDYLQGHNVPHDGVYSNLSDAELERNYANLEPHLSVSTVQASPMERLKRRASDLGIDLDALIERKGREFAESGMGTGGGFFPNLYDPEFVAELLRDEIKERMKPTTATNGGRPTQKVIYEDAVETYLLDGWRYIGSLNGDKVIVER